MNLLTLLKEKKIIDGKTAAVALSETRGSDESIESFLIKRGVDADAILAAKGEYYGIPVQKIDTAVPYDVLRFIPEESARHYRFVPIGVEEGALLVGVTDPDNLEARDALNFISEKVRMPFKLFIISEADFLAVLDSYKGLTGEVSQALGELDIANLKDDEGVEIVQQRDEEISKEAVIAEDAPVTKIVATMLRYAVEGNASDIHVEPTPSQVRVRFRVDGVLNTTLTLPLKVHAAVVARIKVLSSVKLDEKRKPQDGRFSARIEGKKIDFRVSTFPTYYGEKVEMRILNTDKGVRRLDKLGLSERNIRLIREAIQKPYGLVLISGPTGSGKSTTLYSMLNEVDRESKNVVSLEDPVEYNISGMNQSQVRPEIGYTFATGLRSILRQDPNIIMVGEIRDKETAELAIQASLTGHLVLSTIHTNNAVGVIPRLIDMGVDPYLIPPTLNIAIAQRLVRTLCPGSGKEVRVEGSTKVLIEKEFEDLPAEFRKTLPAIKALYKAESSADCPNGTRGRMAVFEVLPMTPQIERTILTDASEEKIYASARQGGMLTMKEDALIKCAEQLIPFEEVNTLGGEMLSLVSE